MNKKKYLSKERREAVQAVDSLSAGDYEVLLGLLANGDWRSLSDLVTLWGYVVPRGWPASSGTCEELRARREATDRAERNLERARRRSQAAARGRPPDAAAAAPQSGAATR